MHFSYFLSNFFFWEGGGGGGGGVAWGGTGGVGEGQLFLVALQE